MARNENVIVLGDGLEQRQNQKTGRSRFSVAIKADRLVVNLDPKSLGAPVAQAIALHLKQAVKGITAQASEATIQRRERSRREFAQGQAGAMRRYSGGRTGAKMPAQSDSVFNDSWRFADSIAVGMAGDAWRVNVAANRLDERTLGVAGVQRVYATLLRYVPEFADMAKLMASSDIVRAQIKAREKVIQKVPAGSGLSRALELVNTAIDTVQNVANLFGT